jgi:hypothetical protein
MTMKKTRYLRRMAGLVLAGVALAAALSGCASRGDTKTAQKGAAQLWSENCNRCHNGRPPGEFSDTQWDVIVTHMRIRACLTGEEQRQILAFLQASN